MLTLKRKEGENIVINDDLTIVVVKIAKNYVLLGVDVPKQVPVHKREIMDYEPEGRKGEKKRMRMKKGKKKTS